MLNRRVLTNNNGQNQNNTNTFQVLPMHNPFHTLSPFDRKLSNRSELIIIHACAYESLVCCGAAKKIEINRDLREVKINTELEV